jgi:diguanylate cyclase (GGDEF)-like protein
LRFAFKFVITVALVATLAYVGLASGRGAGHVPAIWWANSGLASVMLLDRRRRWLQLLAAGYLGNAFAHLLFHDPFWEVIALSACDTAETAIAVYGVGLALGRRVDLTRQPQLLRFVGFAVLLAPFIASLLAGAILRIATGSPLSVALKWFPASALGMSIVVPVVLGLARRETGELFARDQLANTLLYLLLIAAATVAIFTGSDFPWLFLIFPPLLFLVVRLGLSGGVLGCCVVAAIGTHFTVAANGGPFAQLTDASLENRILILQLFLATAVLSVSVVAIVFADLKRASAAATLSEARLRELASSIEALATVDALTGIANRRQFDRAIQLEWQRAQRQHSPLTLLLLDVDRFKGFNDLYGHIEGDNCLCAIARIAVETTRRSSDTVARLGGEEFAVILPGTTSQGAPEMAEKIRQGVLEMGTVHEGNSHGVVTISIGCATVVPAEESNTLELMASADAALYEAKSAGRNCVKAASSQ